MAYVGYTLFTVGCFFCLLNIYISFLRFPLHRLRGGTRDDFKWSSGAPIIGSLIVLLSIGFVASVPLLHGFGIFCMIFDTGGLHWFAGTMAYMYLSGKS